MNSIIVLLVSISFIFSNYNQFNQAFIDVSKEQSPAIVSIISRFRPSTKKKLWESEK